MMLNSVDFSGRPFHFIGIGGIGMSALAHVLTKRCFPVSGSDVRLNHITQRLQAEGAHIFSHQDAANLSFFTTAQPPSITSQAAVPQTLPQVVCSTAISDSNPEYKAATELGCPILHRSDLLAALIKDYRSIAVAGTHGKTTTSSLIGYLLVEAGLDPTVIIGGEVPTLGGNARLGAGPHLVAEADESDGSLVKLFAEIGIITNVELDHPDHYDSLDDVIQIFETFTQHCQIIVGCIDCSNVRDRLKIDISYSLDPDSGADYVARNITYQAQGTSADIWERGTALGRLNVPLLGEHNLRNTLAAVAVGRKLGLDFATITQVLPNFEGARRRFECKGTYRNILFIDDYAHHPSELRATLTSARIRTRQGGSQAQGRVIAIFQPHRYSRTRAFLDEFSRSFQEADRVILTDIYAAGETNEFGITGQDVANSVSNHHAAVDYCESFETVYDLLTQTLEPGDIALFLGAGNLNQMIPRVMAYYHQDSESLSREYCSQV